MQNSQIPLDDRWIEMPHFVLCTGGSTVVLDSNHLQLRSWPWRNSSFANPSDTTLPAFELPPCGDDHDLFTLITPKEGFTNVTSTTEKYQVAGVYVMPATTAGLDVSLRLHGNILSILQNRCVETLFIFNRKQSDVGIGLISSRCIHHVRFLNSGPSSLA